MLPVLLHRGRRPGFRIPVVFELSPFRRVRPGSPVAGTGFLKGQISSRLSYSCDYPFASPFESAEKELVMIAMYKCWVAVLET